MKKIKFNFDEEVLEETLSNGLKVYMYNTNKTKNFYVTVSTHFGSQAMKYKKGNNTYEVTKGSAHFLEHRVMDFTKNKEAMKKINEYGSFVNAYTTYNGTNYNIFGSNKIIENMSLLFDRVFKANIKKTDVENERGIILEEYYMYMDDPYFILHKNLYENAFNKSYIKYPVLGTKEGIENVQTEELKRLYKDFYTPDNMFIVVTGSFNPDEVLNYIKNYTKSIHPAKEKIKIIKPKEDENVNVEYEELSLNVGEPKVIVGYKSKIPDKIDELKFRIILGMALSEEFSTTGSAFEELDKLGIKRTNYGIEIADNYILMYFKASTDKIEDFTNVIDKYINNLQMNEESLERKKRSRLSNLVLSFEDLEGVEDNITTSILRYNKLINNIDEITKSILLKDVNKILKCLNKTNKSTLIIK